ncbi:CUB domain-containing protein 2-like [Oculina patagonica]
MSFKKSTSSLTGCGSVVGNTLTSPGYPNNYPSNMDCSYVVPITDGKAMKIDFRHFDVGYLTSCKDDFVNITNDKDQAFGLFCGQRTGKTVLVTGTSVVIKFHSDFFLEKGGFQLFFTPVPLGSDMQPPAECGTVVNNLLKSPGYPKNYPRNTHCVYSVNIPRDMEMKIDFNDFEMEDGPSCFCDYLKITNGKNETFGVCCGQKTGQHILVTGDLALITFHSDYSYQKRGFLLFLNFIPIVLPKITSPASVVRSLPYFRLTCSATGSPPLYTAVIRKSATLINTTNTATIQLQFKGNYTCVATNKHGTDVRNFLVIFNDCSCQSYSSQELGNQLICTGHMAPLEELIKCAPLSTNIM